MSGARGVTPLMEMLIAAGYPEDGMYSHESDLYVYATPLTKRVIKQWCSENHFSMDVFCKLFKENGTGAPMYDIAFQYLPYWERVASERT